MRNKNPTLGPSGTQMKREAKLLVATGLFPKYPETFRAYFGCNNSSYIFATPRFLAINLRNPHYITLMLKVSRSKQADCSVTTGSSALTSFRDFQEIDCRIEKLKADLKYNSSCTYFKIF